jgi:hypothetical protein
MHQEPSATAEPTLPPLRVRAAVDELLAVDHELCQKVMEAAVQSPSIWLLLEKVVTYAAMSLVLAKVLSPNSEKTFQETAAKLARVTSSSALLKKFVRRLINEDVATRDALKDCVPYQLFMERQQYLIATACS